MIKLKAMGMLRLIPRMLALMAVRGTQQLQGQQALRAKHNKGDLVGSQLGTNPQF